MQFAYVDLKEGKNEMKVNQNNMDVTWKEIDKKSDKWMKSKTVWMYEG